MAKVTVSGRSYEVEVRGDSVIVDGHEYPVTVREDAGMAHVNAGGVNYRVQLPADGERASGMTVNVDYRPFVFEYDGRFGAGPAPRAARASTGATAAAPAAAVKGAVTAQIAGRVLSVRVKPGDTVARGDVLLILEAMKMENEIKASSDGTVKDVLVAEGSRVSEGAPLVVVE
ncbi:acetyl-CoA carboxylase biotin carboxyl carrier protein subunit [bacterium]|nr:acetyl-CoA carboxylase biotin carboxyl carrier protein subunit [bacterium]